MQRAVMPSARTRHLETRVELQPLVHKHMHAATRDRSARLRLAHQLGALPQLHHCLPEKQRWRDLHARVRRDGEVARVAHMVGVGLAAARAQRAEGVLDSVVTHQQHQPDPREGHRHRGEERLQQAQRVAVQLALQPDGRAARLRAGQAVPVTQLSPHARVGEAGGRVGAGRCKVGLPDRAARWCVAAALREHIRDGGLEPRRLLRVAATTIAVAVAVAVASIATAATAAAAAAVAVAGFVTAIELEE